MLNHLLPHTVLFWIRSHSPRHVIWRNRPCLCLTPPQSWNQPGCLLDPLECIRVQERDHWGATAERGALFFPGRWILFIFFNTSLPSFFLPDAVSHKFSFSAPHWLVWMSTRSGLPCVYRMGSYIDRLPTVNTLQNGGTSTSLIHWRKMCRPLFLLKSQCM